MTSRTSRYGWKQHRTPREQLRPHVDRGDAYCAEIICLEELDGRGRWIEPGTPWDLAHNRETGEHLGPAHARCNRAEGARYRNRPRNPNPASREW